MRIWLVHFPYAINIYINNNNAFRVKHIKYHKSLYKDGFKRAEGM